MRFCKSDRVNPAFHRDVTTSLRVTVSRDDVTWALRRHGDAPIGAVTIGRISRRKRSACFSTTRFCKSDRVNPPLQRQT
jgi:hypothetical protein